MGSKGFEDSDKVNNENCLKIGPVADSVACRASATE